MPLRPESEVGEEGGGPRERRGGGGSAGEGGGCREGTSWTDNPCTLMTSSSCTCIYTHRGGPKHRPHFRDFQVRRRQEEAPESRPAPRVSEVCGPGWRALSRDDGRKEAAAAVRRAPGPLLLESGLR